MPPARPTSTSAAVIAYQVAFGARETGIRLHGAIPILDVALPILHGPETESLLIGAEATTSREGCTLFQGAGTLAGFVVGAAAADLEIVTRELYRRVFSATRGRRLHRMWNYVPRINRVERGLENYRRFCRGRSLAFEEHFGPAFHRELPAASAVGVDGGPLAVAFLAGDAAPRHFENPRQIPAFEYPADYGPRPPSFSRATLVEEAPPKQLFISGTAAIRGHATMAAADLAGQLACTVENLGLIAETAGAAPRLTGDAWQRVFKVYIRHADEFPAVRDFLQRHLLRPGDLVTYLHADLCRADLRVEIEAVFSQS